MRQKREEVEILVRMNAPSVSRQVAGIRGDVGVGANTSWPTRPDIPHQGRYRHPQWGQLA
jgi:hypothetical protein